MKYILYICKYLFKKKENKENSSLSIPTDSKKGFASLQAFYSIKWHTLYCLGQDDLNKPGKFKETIKVQLDSFIEIHGHKI